MPADHRRRDMVSQVFTPLGGIFSDHFKAHKLFLILANAIIAAARVALTTVAFIISTSHLAYSFQVWIRRPLRRGYPEHLPTVSFCPVRATAHAPR